MKITTICGLQYQVATRNLQNFSLIMSSDLLGYTLTIRTFVSFVKWSSVSVIFVIALFQVPSEKLARGGHVLRTLLLTRSPQMIADRKFHLRTYRRCMVGSEMVVWLMQQSSPLHGRAQAIGMWQALLEESVIVHG